MASAMTIPRKRRLHLPSTLALSAREHRLVIPNRHNFSGRMGNQSLYPPTSYIALLARRAKGIDSIMRVSRQSFVTAACCARGVIHGPARVHDSGKPRIWN
ncbi:hypothetical protein CC1G_14651 [Coprinopsis cinerea okayama7|uniref:Uncharacterized protein n=1 Tax=Coprinopsis cinerea (strain Okayama-7 / 130 / ATCC MYA-4618 / FGSC 9003) TaxID=240176 RepID=D6RMI9_COPC7|nr:hypothetical protein CC1G_14651 [Coprinopsis cinerea okayama7\|eukprot:XP_002911222.1 hypothetical protein CC1G_14651 [Coprinopsis cinerea okayama7\